MENIVKIENNKANVSIADISVFSGVSTKAIIKAIRTSSKKFKEFGLSLGSDVTLKGTILNEASATFLLTLLSNTPKVIEFKFNLVMQFYKMRELTCATNQKQIEDKNKAISELKKSKRSICKNERVRI